MIKYASLHCGEHIQSQPFLRKSSKIFDPYRLAGLVWIVAGVMSCLILAVSASSQTVKPTPDDEPIRVKTTLVNVPVVVTDRDGRYVTDLKKEEFKLFEGGVEQEVAIFEPSEQPVTVIFLADVSSSMMDHRENLNIAVRQMARRLRPQDRIELMTFFQWTKSLVGPMQISEVDKWPLLNTVETPDCPTYLYNAVDDGLNKMARLTGRRAIMLFTDGSGEGFGVSANDNFRKAEEMGVMIYTFKFGTHDPEPPPHTISKKIYAERIANIYGYLNDLSAKSGGRSFQIESITDIATTFGEVTAELSRQYRLSYYPKTETAIGNVRDIKVKVSRPNVAVTAKSNKVIGGRLDLPTKR